ncbi:MAG: thioredoxin family protein [Marinilabiliaceae bacterium]|nr:thioredoxin family protein [Marinilabiliaceae bacterium]
MTGKERVLKTIQLEQTDRTPWVPFVGCHGATLLGLTATDYLKSANHIVNGISKAIELYNPDGIPVIFDLQLEAEALGCELTWADNNPPAVTDHVLTNGKTLSDLIIPDKNSGRIPIAIEATKKIRELHPDIALYGLITGPFTLTLHLLGTDIFMKMMEAPDEVIEIMEFTNEVAKTMATYYIEAGCDIIAVVDPMTSQIDPTMFEQFVTPSAIDLFSFIREKKALSSFFVCGHAEQNIEVMCKCKPDNISIDENISLTYVKDIALKHNISFGGNLKLTVVMLMGTEEDNQINALECIDLGGNKGFILAPGCDLPMNTPIENIQAITTIVSDSYQQKVLRAKEKSETSIELLNMKDYGSTGKVIVDIITLDSESCAPCQYMVEAVKHIAPHFDGLVEWREHAIKKMEAVSFMNSLMVKNIPTICIDGKIAFVSQIPPKQKLIDTIQSRLNEKLKNIILSKNAELTIITQDETSGNELKSNIETAMKETGKHYKININTTEKLASKYGVYEFPAVILTEHKIKSQGETPKVEIIKEWLKDL